MKPRRAATWTLSILLSAVTLRGAPAGVYRETVSEIMARQRPADGVAPIPIPRRAAPRWNLPGNPASPARPTFPEARRPVAAPLPSAPPTLGVTFLGAQLSEA